MPDRSQNDNNNDQQMEDNNNGGMFGQAMGNGYSGYMWFGRNHKYLWLTPLYDSQKRNLIDDKLPYC